MSSMTKITLRVDNNRTKFVFVTKIKTAHCKDSLTMLIPKCLNVLSGLKTNHC